MSALSFLASIHSLAVHQGFVVHIRELCSFLCLMHGLLCNFSRHTERIFGIPQWKSLRSKLGVWRVISSLTIISSQIYSLIISCCNFNSVRTCIAFQVADECQKTLLHRFDHALLSRIHIEV